MAFYATKEEILNDPEVESIVTDISIDEDSDFLLKQKPRDIGMIGDNAFEYHPDYDYCTTLSKISPKRFVVVKRNKTVTIKGVEKNLYSYYDRRLRQLGTDMFLEASSVFKDPIKSSSPAFSIVKSFNGANNIHYLHSGEFFSLEPENVIVSGPIETLKGCPVVITNKYSKLKTLFDPSKKAYLTLESPYLIFPSQDPEMPFNQMSWVVAYDQKKEKHYVNCFEGERIQTYDYIPCSPVFFTNDLIISDDGADSLSICTKIDGIIRSRSYKMGEKWCDQFIQDVYDKQLDELSIVKLIVERKPEVVLDLPSSILGKKKYLKPIMESVQKGVENNIPSDSSEFENYLKFASNIKEQFVMLANVSIQDRNEKIEKYKHDVELYEDNYKKVVQKEIESENEYKHSLEFMKKNVSNLFSDVNFDEKQ